LIRSEALFNPFPGLRPFESDEDHLFFGREKQIDDLLRRLRSSRFLSVVGTSGSGKSSLVRSGLIPTLQSGFMVGAGSSWRVLTFRPGDDAIGNLASSLNAPDILGAERELASTNRILLEATLRRGALGLVNAVRQARIPHHDNLLVVVDQFEELFRFRRSRQIQNSRDDAIAFVKLLLAATQQNELPIYIVLTMRSDFIGDCMEYPGLPEAVNAGQYLVPRMTRDELRSAITGPVAVGGGEIAPRLVLRLLNDLGDNLDQLPVLQHALMRTWDHWEHHRQSDAPIDIADYEAVGTLEHALSRHAEEAFQETGSGRNPQTAERMFKALTDTFSDQRGVRRPTSVRELAAICEAPELEVIQIVEFFRRPGRSFLMPPSTVPLQSRSIIDLSHESLMRCWIRLIEWAEEERVSAGSYVRLSQAAAWFEEGTAGLWRNPELELGVRWRRQNQPPSAWAERYHPFFAKAMEFLDRSEKERDRIEAEQENERKRKLRHSQWVSAILGTMLVIALSLAYLAWKEKGTAQGNFQLAKRAVDESLSSAGGERAREAADMPGMEEFRRELLDKAKNFYNNYLLKLNPRDQVLSEETALAYSRMGDINRLLGNHEDAIADYKEAIDRLDKLASRYPNEPEYRQDLGYAHNWQGETLRDWLQEPDTSSPYSNSDAEKEYDKALLLQQVLHDESPENGDYQQELARTYYNRGILRSNNQQRDESESDFREAIRLLQPLAEKNTETPAQKKAGPPPSQDLARAYNDLGTLLRLEGHPEQAEKFYELAIGIHEELAKKDPANREYKLELALFLDNLAALQLNANQIELANENNHKAFDFIEELLTPLPSSLLGTQQARAFLLQDFLEKSKNADNSGGHPEFHVKFASLADNYAELARQDLRSGSMKEAKEALECLYGVLPELSAPDRKRSTKPYYELQGELHKRMAQQK
jgi:tetratricopeptide (TPR) repeat protein/energy-coupling factor transporter ATP-binding protein EcfA2